MNLQEQEEEHNLEILLPTEQQKQTYKAVMSKKNAFQFNDSINILQPLIHSFIQDNIGIFREILCKPKKKLQEFTIKINEKLEMAYEQQQQYVLSKLLNVLVELYGQLTQYKNALNLCELNKKLLHNLFLQLQTSELLKMLSLCYSKTAKSNFFLSSYKNCETDFLICRTMLSTNNLQNSFEYATLLLIEGNYFRFMFKDSEAEKCYMKGQSLMKSIFGEESMQFADSCYGLANLQLINLML